MDILNNKKGASMAGKIKKIIDQIVEQRSGGNETLKHTTMTKLQLKGIRINDFTASSPDDPAVINKLYEIAGQLSVKVNV